MGNDVFIHLNGVEDSTSFVEVERMWCPPRRRLLRQQSAAPQRRPPTARTPSTGTGARMTFTAAVSGGTAATPVIRAALLFTPAASAFVPPAPPAPPTPLLSSAISALQGERVVADEEKNVCSCTSPAERDGASVVAGASSPLQRR